MRTHLNIYRFGLQVAFLLTFVMAKAEGTQESSRPLIGVRTNLLYDLWYQPQFGWAPGANLQLEYFPQESRLSLNAGFTFHNHKHWSDYQFFQIRDVDLEARWYFAPPGKYVGPYAGVDVHGTWYGIGFSKTKGWRGEGGGGGLVLGWSHYLNNSHRWRIDLNVGFGFFSTRYDPYQYGDPSMDEEDGKYYYSYHGDVDLFKKRQHRFQWIGPTQAGVHLTYILYQRKKGDGR